MKRILVLVKIGLCAAFFTVSCNNNTKLNKEVQFYYYPKTNVYYNVASKTYTYSLDGGKTWRNMNSEADKEPSTLGEKIVLTSITDSIWKENEVHRKLYAGKLYDIIDDTTNGANGDNLGAVAGKVSERKAVQKGSKTKTRRKAKVEVKEEKRPIKKFFQKIFGKNQKN